MAGIYIHIPFCSTKCGYCDFFSIVNSSDKTDYVKAMCKELALRANYIETKQVDTVYFGGGTPSELTEQHLELLFETINKNFKLNINGEISLEANPQNLTTNFLRNLKKYTPINRLSIGLQSFRKKELQFMNRVHTADEAVNAVHKAQKLGFKNITGDLIFGLPRQTLEHWQYNLNHFFELNIPHLSAYSLSIEQGTAFYYKKQKNKIEEVDDVLSKKMYDTLIEIALKNNFFHYEISNFAREKYIAKHNFSYWSGKKYLGIGASAHSYNGQSRQYNICSVKKYINSINKNNIPCEIEILSKNDIFNEYILTHLRTFLGINTTYLNKTYPIFMQQISKNIDNMLQQKLLIKQNHRLVLAKQAKFISDTVISELLC